MKKEVRVTWQGMSMSTLRGGHEWKSRFRVGVGSDVLGFLCLRGLQGQPGVCDGPTRRDLGRDPSCRAEDASVWGLLSCASSTPFPGISKSPLSCQAEVLPPRPGSQPRRAGPRRLSSLLDCTLEVIATSGPRTPHGLCLGSLQGGATLLHLWQTPRYPT